MTPRVVFAVFVATVSACTDPGYRVVVDFEPTELADEVRILELLLARDACAADPSDHAAGPPATSVSSRQTLTRADSTSGLGEVAPGRYALYAIGRGDGCDAIAAGCVPVQLEADGEGTIVVPVGRATSARCADGTMCIDGTCLPPPPPDASVPADSGPPPDSGAICEFLGDCETIVAIDAGHDHVCALLGDGRVVCWGSNGSGQRGPGADGNNPSLLPGIDDATDVSAGGLYTCVVHGAGETSCFGYGSSFPEMPDIVVALAPVADIEVGNRHTCATLTNGSVQCFGDDGSGQLGDGDLDSDPGPGTVVGLSSPTSLVLGDFHSCATLAGGLMQCWGDNDFGQLGIADISSRYGTPQTVAVGGEPVEVAAGRWFTCVRLPDGSVRCFGHNEAGQLGPGSMEILDPTPTPITDINDATAVAAGLESACVIVDGRVSCWGARAPLTPQLRASGVGGTSTARLITMGDGVICIVEDAGAVKCAGDNDMGQLGDGVTMSRDRFGSVPHF